MELFKEPEVALEPPLAAYLQAKEEGRHVAPYVPTWGPAPLSLLCRKAIAWNAAGLKEPAGELARFLIRYESLPTLWSSEKEYNEEELKNLFSKVKEIPLSKNEPSQKGADIFQSFSFSAAFNQVAKGSLGVIRAGNVEIRAMGPEPLPLSDPGQLGIRGPGTDGWSACFATPEIWLKSAFGVKDEECNLSLHFVGLSLDAALAFSFYVKAPSCRVGEEVLKPKTLTRLQTQSNVVQFNHIVIESTKVHKIQIIPLAGAGGFWDSDFLVAFELHPLNPQLSFSIRVS